MTTLKQVYTTKAERSIINGIIDTLEANGIRVFTLNMQPGNPNSNDVSIHVNAHDHDRAEVLLHDIYFPEKEKLPGEFVCLEIQDENGELKGLNIFYDGILQHTWKRVPAQPEGMPATHEEVLA